MKKIVFPLLLVLGLTSFGQTQDFSPRQIRLRQHIEYLASDELRGREAGTDDALRAAQYIIEQYQSAGLKPLYQNWLVPFNAPQSDFASSPLGENLGAQVDGILNSMSDGKEFRNVVAVIEGSDPELRQEIILIGAHYDHLGVRGGKVYNGADDNASGTACVIELARTLMAQREQLKRTVVICAFDAEELGLYGSKVLAQRLENQQNIKLMMSIDMVGWYRQSGHLIMEGTATLDGLQAQAREQARQCGIELKCKKVETSMLTATDTEPFAKRGIPTLAVTTGVKSPYHQPGDDAELIDYEGLDQIVEYLSGLTLALAQEEQMQPSGKRAVKHGGREPLFTMGLTAGLNQTRVNFPAAAFSSNSRLGYEGGLSMRFNLNYLVVETGLSAHYSRTYMPTLDLEHGSASYIARESLNLSGLTIPATVAFNLSRRTLGIDVLVGGGVYYTHLFQRPLVGGQEAHDPFGVRIAYQMRIARFAWGLSADWQMNNLISPNPPRLQARQTRFHLTYYLW